ncbi:hypothetical protein MCEL_18780 [Mycolicibacterium celeriflavum]|uniref:Uncharacterized protein n=1 Tax=Mycolicibacterium celeriflavum TaxID=1249101 RepID=A0A7I7RGI6_MYCCF|nr:hypothetical protein MCEL_18780 [Mycolicibacterium celeriflavum]
MFDRDYVDLDECARRMDLTKAQVMHLVRIRALRGFYAGFGLWFVEPAIVTGAVTTP